MNKTQLCIYDEQSKLVFLKTFENFDEAVEFYKNKLGEKYKFYEYQIYYCVTNFLS